MVLKKINRKLSELAQIVFGQNCSDWATDWTDETDLKNNLNNLK